MCPGAPPSGPHVPHLPHVHTFDPLRIVGRIEKEHLITTGSTEEERAEAPPRAIELIATEWLASERAETALATPRTEAAARRLAAEYEEAIRAASQEELRLAWEAARAVQARCDMGSLEWAQARSVSELLRTEYEATR